MFNSITEFSVSDNYYVEKKLDTLIEVARAQNETTKGLISVVREMVLELKQMNSRLSSLERQYAN